MSQHPNTQVASGSIFHLTKPEFSGLKKNHKIISRVSEGKSPSDYETAWSPTSPLEFRLFPSLVNPKSWDSVKVGLSIVDSLAHDHQHTDSSRILLPSPDSKNMIYGSLMRTGNPFVYNNNVCQVLMKQSLNSRAKSDMEISEDYTCVISHGPNPKTTHIYGDEVLESLENNEIKGRCCGIKKESIFVVSPLDLTTVTDMLVLPPSDFLRFCFSCSKKLGMGKDIYMYRGYKAFCSTECRLEVIHQDEKTEEEEDEAAKSDSYSEEDLSKKKSNRVIFTVG